MNIREFQAFLPMVLRGNGGGFRQHPGRCSHVRRFAGRAGEEGGKVVVIRKLVRDFGQSGRAVWPSDAEKLGQDLAIERGEPRDGWTIPRKLRLRPGLVCAQ